MASAWESVMETYNYLIEDLSHPLTRNFEMMLRPVTLLSILATYNLFCLKLGPMLMKDRQPYKLKSVIRVYNIVQILICMHITWEGIVFLFFKEFDFRCQPVGDGDARLARAAQWYFIMKIADLLDTIFFVLRKSDRQITFLHLYHHNVMPIVSWIGLKYFPGGQGVILGTLNSFVHVVMYTYYFMSSLGPKYQKYLWWKKYLTLLQILQFTILLVHGANSLRYSCGYPIILKLITIVEAVTFIYMFGKFYIKSYEVKDNSKSERVTNVKSINNGHSANGDSDLKNGHYLRNRISKEKSNYEYGKKIKGL